MQSPHTSPGILAINYKTPFIIIECLPASWLSTAYADTDLMYDFAGHIVVVQLQMGEFSNERSKTFSFSYFGSRNFFIVHNKQTFNINQMLGLILKPLKFSYCGYLPHITVS